MGNPNRKMRRGKPQGMSYADVLAQKKRVKEATEKAAMDTTVQIRTDIRTQRAMWLMCVAMNDAFHIGPRRFMQFAECLQARSDWYSALAEEDEEVALEKLRKEAMRCSGVDIDYIYEKEIRAAKERHEAAGLVFDVPERSALY